MSLFKREKWQIVETSTYPNGGGVKTRIVEQRLSRRGAVRAVAEWQGASNRNKLLVLAIATSARDLPDVVYSTVPHSAAGLGDTQHED